MSPSVEVTEYVQPFLLSLGMKGAENGQTNPRQIFCALQQWLQASHRKICLVLLRERLNQTSRLFILEHVCSTSTAGLRQGELQWLPFSGQPVPNLCSTRACVTHVWCSQLPQVCLETSNFGFIHFNCCPRAEPEFQCSCTSQTPPAFPSPSEWPCCCKITPVSANPCTKPASRTQASLCPCVWSKGGGKLSCPQEQYSSLAVAGPLELKWECQQR